jgi:outer membrane protein TolC
MKRHAHRVGGLTVLSAVLLSGCAISPTALTTDEIAMGAQDKLTRVTQQQQPIAGAIDLQEAMARALKYNLDQKVEIYEISLKVAELDLAHWNLLPNVVASSGFSDRNKASASSSYNLQSNTQNFGYSTSQDYREKTAELSFSWNILDFGLSYVRAQQAADKALIAKESRRKVVVRLMEDVRAAYWRAYSAQRLSSRLVTLERRTRAAMASSSALAVDRTTSPITAFTYRRELIEIQRTLLELQRELTVATFQLAALMNIAPGTPFVLAAPTPMAVSPVAAAGSAELTRIALENRPELRDLEYQKRINIREADAALLELLPGIQLYAGPSFDSNSFLLNHEWLGWGAKASWNLLKVFQYPARNNVVEGRTEALDQRALAMAMAIMTQVYVSRARIATFKREVEAASAYYDNQQSLLQAIRAEHAANKVSEQTLLREELNAAVGDVRLSIARASLETAKANLNTSLGLDPAATNISQSASVAEIATVLRRDGVIAAPNSPQLVPVRLSRN